MAANRKINPRIWETTYLLNRAMSEAIRTVVPRYFPAQSTARILDVGCGHMPYRELFKGRYGEYIGCDLYPRDASVVKCPSDALSFPDESFDAVVCFQVLEHVPTPWRTVAECTRVLRPGGRCMITAPFMFPHHSSPQDYYRYTHDGLCALADGAGLKTEYVSAYCGSWATVCLIACWLLGGNLDGLRRRRLGWMATVLRWVSIVPLNCIGHLFEHPRLRRDYEKGNQAYANYLMIARKPDPVRAGVPVPAAVAKPME